VNVAAITEQSSDVLIDIFFLVVLFILRSTRASHPGHCNHHWKYQQEQVAIIQKMSFLKQADQTSSSHRDFVAFSFCAFFESVL
jgi:hypothetical protein